MFHLQQQFSGRGPGPPESETLVMDPTLGVLTCSRGDLSWAPGINRFTSEFKIRPSRGRVFRVGTVSSILPS